MKTNKQEHEEYEIPETTARIVIEKLAQMT